jgi:hypothetical protein
MKPSNDHELVIARIVDRIDMDAADPMDGSTGDRWSQSDSKR